MNLNYISLFSGAGIGCYRLNELGFKCIATVELEEKRINIQKINKKCENDYSYICNDISLQTTKDKIYEVSNKLLKNEPLTLIIATPPCQGMSVANHKKSNEKRRNSLVVDSVKIVDTMLPHFFIFENVFSFLSTLCSDGEVDLKIKDLINKYLSKNYLIYFNVVNLKNYGSFSSRTRTIVIGVKKGLNISPINLFPEYREEKKLIDVIGQFPSLKKMGEIYKDDIYHQFRSYDIRMLDWIKDIKEGESAFDNKDPLKRPHKIINSVIVENTNKNGDKYKRQSWDKVAPCIHTRNDILSSQNTIHPVDNRVFSIRELMRLMNIPDSFKWSNIELNNLIDKEKELFLKQNELNIRKCIGEGVPSIIFYEIASKIKNELSLIVKTKKEIKELKKSNINIYNFVNEYKNNLNFNSILKIVEELKTDRKSKATFFTSQEICFRMINSLPDLKNKETIKILEPSCGIGSFIPQLIKKYNGKRIEIDCIDTDIENIKIAKLLFKSINNIKINFINADFLLYDNVKNYDIILGNPPFGNIIKDKKLLKKYKYNSVLKNTNNIFAFFVEKALKYTDYLFFITPKSLLNAPEFSELRKLINRKKILEINDYGEKAFDIKIETISFLIENKLSNENTITKVSYNNDEEVINKQYYFTKNIFDIWLLYRNDFFDSVCSRLEFGIFRVFRDRQITKNKLKSNGKYRVIKSRNIANNTIIDIPNYDKFIDNIDGLLVSKFLNSNSQTIIVPNFTYYPRATILPKNSIADGSVAILTSNKNITNENLEYFSSEEFYLFYKIARNFSTRTLNIDSNSVKFFGIFKNKY